MPRLTTVELRVPDGPGPAVGFAALARLLETAATTASTEAGFSPGWYAVEGTVWVIRRSTIECATPVAPGTTLEIRTWVGDFRRVRSIREYEAYREAVPVLRARTDWVYVELPAGKPRRIPDAMMRAFVAEGAGTMSRAALALGEPTASAEPVEWSVAGDDLDALGHVNNAKYFDYVESAARAVVGHATRPERHDVEYVDEARLGERLRALVWRVDSAHEDGDVVATEIRRTADGAVVTRALSRFARD